MEASAGLVAGSHNRNELVVIHGHEEVTMPMLISKLKQFIIHVMFVDMHLIVTICMFGTLEHNGIWLRKSYTIQ